MRRIVAAGASAVLVLALGGGCAGEEERAPVVRLDGSPRVPDDEGVATALSPTSITLDGTRTYPVSRRLLAFSTYDGRLEPMLNRRGQYVQVGLGREGGRTVMVWMAGIAAVVPGDVPAVYYQGAYLRTERGRAVFRDGTVLRLGPGVKPPEQPAPVLARIDPRSHSVVELRSP